jgi:hypothetical protein
MMELAVTSADEAVISFLDPNVARRRRVRFCEQKAAPATAASKLLLTISWLLWVMLSIHLLNLIEGAWSAAAIPGHHSRSRSMETTDEFR